MTTETAWPVRPGPIRTGAIRAASATRTAIASEWFFRALVAIFVANALIVAFAARHFLLYDEFFHFRIAELYTGQWSPLIADGSSVTGLGDVERSSSYLFHYLMSFPLRLGQAIGLDLHGQVVLLRVICVVMAAGALPFFRRALTMIGVRPVLAHSALALFVLPPVVVFVAATVNYDNLVLLLGSMFIVAAIRAYTAAEPNVRALAALVVVGCAASLAKVSFLPVFAAAVLLILIREIHLGRVEGVRARWSASVLPALRSPWTWIVGSLLVVLVVLFVERMFGNILFYGTPDPDCARVQTEELCRTYGVWRRNEALAAAAPDAAPSLGGVLVYLSGTWLPQSVLTALVVGGETAQGVRTSSGTLLAQSLLPSIVAIATFLGLLMITKVARNAGARIVLVMAAAYIGLLFATNYRLALEYGVALAIQSRYLLLFLPFVIGAAVVALGRALDAMQRSPWAWKLMFVLLAVAGALQGAGAIGYLIGSDQTWIADTFFTPVVAPLRALVAAFVIGA
ncbi:hypothetical protein [Agromyces sp. SYSU T0242]|uniref:hypothetical protein n=1 Tax=Agromyces litoreus TaxID=3158561 RepID=UPI003397E943